MTIYLYGSCKCKPNVIIVGALNKNLTLEDYIALTTDGVVTNCPFCNEEVELKVKESNNDV